MNTQYITSLLAIFLVLFVFSPFVQANTITKSGKTGRIQFLLPSATEWQGHDEHTTRRPRKIMFQWISVDQPLTG